MVTKKSSKREEDGRVRQEEKKRRPSGDFEEPLDSKSRKRMCLGCVMGRLVPRQSEKHRRMTRVESLP